MRVVRILAILIIVFLVVAPLACSGGGEQTAPLNQMEAALLEILLDDETYSNPYSEDTYEEEHYARDLEDNLEEMDYNVSFLVILQYDDELTWVPLLKVSYTDDSFSLIDAGTDLIVTTDYDGDGDGTVETLTNQTYEEIDDAFDNLIATGEGNDGRYLIFEFVDYETVLLSDKTVGKELVELYRALQEDNTDKKRYIPHLHDCDDFARELEDALEARGFQVRIKLVWWMDESSEVKGHAIVDVVIDDVENGDIAVEPQNDGFPEEYDDDGDGKIGRYWQPSLIQHQIWFELWKKGWYSGSDGKYWIEEYEDFDNIPFPLDPTIYELEIPDPIVPSGGEAAIALKISSTASHDMEGNISCDGGYVVPLDDTGLYYTWYAESETGDPLDPGTYNIIASLTDRWQRTTTSSLAIEVVPPDAGGEDGAPHVTPTSTPTQAVATATPTFVPPEPEEVLYGYLYIYTECAYMDEQCVSCTISADFYGQDLTAGEYPVTNVMLKANGQVLHDSGTISETLYEGSASLSAVCGQSYNFELRVTNDIGLESVVTHAIVAEAAE
ncbi:MAG: hypothetical protein WC562_02620 [Dehalococcoidia bacterium]